MKRALRTFRTIPSKGGKKALATNHDIINELSKSYAMELETVENYIDIGDALMQRRSVEVSLKSFDIR